MRDLCVTDSGSQDGTSLYANIEQVSAVSADNVEKSENCIVVLSNYSVATAWYMSMLMASDIT